MTQATTEERLTMDDIRPNQLFICPGVNGVLRKDSSHPCWARKRNQEIVVIYPKETVRKLPPKRKD